MLYKTKDKCQIESVFYVGLFCFLKGFQDSSIKIKNEKPTMLGRIDMIIELEEIIYIVEIKYNSKEKSAI